MKTYKIMRIERKCIQKDYSYAEIVMQAEAQDGWEVVSVAFDVSRDICGDMVITFSRDI